MFQVITSLRHHARPTRFKQMNFRQTSVLTVMFITLHSSVMPVVSRQNFQQNQPRLGGTYILVPVIIIIIKCGP